MWTSPAESTSGSLRRSDSARRTDSGWSCGPAWQGGTPWQVGSARHVSSVRQVGFMGTWREASLNWLALGLLLAAWNAADNDTAAQVQRRPEALRGYSSVSVRAAQRTLSANFASSTNS
jgi:hypothetical protein